MGGQAEVEGLMRSRLIVLSSDAHLTVESAPCPQPLVDPLLADSDLFLDLHPTRSLLNGRFGGQAERTNRSASHTD